MLGSPISSITFDIFLIPSTDIGNRVCSDLSIFGSISMEYEITDERRNYLDARGHIILTACPGSGKTTSIVAKLRDVAQYCALQYGKHAGFACLSFTNKACAELKDKYRVMHEEPLRFPNVVSTIDSFIMQMVVLPFWYLCDLCKKKPVVVNDSETLNRIYYVKYLAHIAASALVENIFCTPYRPLSAL